MVGECCNTLKSAVLLFELNSLYACSHKLLLSLQWMRIVVMSSGLLLVNLVTPGRVYQCLSSSSVLVVLSETNLRVLSALAEREC